MFDHLPNSFIISDVPAHAFRCMLRLAGNLGLIQSGFVQGNHLDFVGGLQALIEGVTLGGQGFTGLTARSGQSQKHLEGRKAVHSRQIIVGEQNSATGLVVAIFQNADQALLEPFHAHGFAIGMLHQVLQVFGQQDRPG